MKHTEKNIKIIIVVDLLLCIILAKHGLPWLALVFAAVILTGIYYVYTGRYEK